MENILANKNIGFLVLPSRFPPKDFINQYQLAYELWHSIWSEALKNEMNLEEHLYSDNFSRQSHIGMILVDQKPACLTTLNYLDLNDPVAQNDSYFKVWPLLSQQKLKGHASKIIICGNLSLHSDFRRGVYGIQWKDLMFAMLVRHLKTTSYDSMVAAVRLEKGMEKAAYRTGAFAISKNLPYSIPGQRVDLVAWGKSIDEAILDPKILSLINMAWNNSWIVNHNQNIEKGEKNAATLQIVS